MTDAKPDPQPAPGVNDGQLCPRCRASQMPKWKQGGAERARACQACGYIQERGGRP